MAWPLFLLYDFVWFVDIPSLCQKQPSAFHYGKWKRPLWEKDWVWFVDVLSLCRKQPSAFHYGKWKRPLWEEDWVWFVDILSVFRKQPSAFHYGKWKRSLWEKDWVCFHIAVSIGIIPSTLQCKSIKIKHILLIDSRARVVWCLLCLRSIYIPRILFRWLTKARKENAPPPFLFIASPILRRTFSTVKSCPLK